MEPGPDADLDAVGARVDERPGSVCRHDIAGDELQLRMRLANALDRRDHAAGMAVRSVDDDDVDARLGKLRDPVERVRCRADRGADPQAPVLVLAGAREIAGLLDVLHRDHAAQSPVRHR